MRKVFLTNWAAFTLMQGQMESLLHRLMQKGLESHRATVRFMEWWLADSKKARAGFQTMVDQIFLDGQRYLEKAKKDSTKERGKGPRDS